MNKTYHFMAGLPRSGSTVLSALINQHPDLYASPQTDLLELLYTLQNKIPNLQGFNAGFLPSGYESVLKQLPNSFYSSIEKPVILDHNRGWGTSYNWNNLRGYLNAYGKVILTVRPILEVLASFVKLANQTEKETQQPPYLNPELYVSHYRNKADAQSDYLMMTNGEIEMTLFSIANLLKNHRDKVLVVWYDDLITKPQETLNSIYRFLELPEHKNNFQQIYSVDKLNDQKGYGIAGLHEIRNKLDNPKTKIENYLSDYSIKKYGNALDFLKPYL